jgi:hypothetical protein
MKKTRRSTVVEAEPRALLDRILAAPVRAAAPTTGALVGTLAGFDPEGRPLVDFPRRRGARPLVARTAVRLGPSDVGTEAVLVFEGGDAGSPIVVGLLRPTVPAAAAYAVELDGERLVLTAEHEIVLRCGEASITLTRAGKVLLRGTYLSSRSSGVNRVRGGSVQIN